MCDSSPVPKRTPYAMSNAKRVAMIEQQQALQVILMQRRFFSSSWKDIEGVDWRRKCGEDVRLGGKRFLKDRGSWRTCKIDED